MGEFAIEPIHTETAARWKWFDWVSRTARKYNTSIMLWGAGADFKVDSAAPWPDPTAIKLMMKAIKGTPNALADSTVDESAPTHFSSARLFLRLGDKANDNNLPFLRNSNDLREVTLSKAKGGKKVLIKDVDYDKTSNALSSKGVFWLGYSRPSPIRASKATSLSACPQGQTCSWKLFFGTRQCSSRRP
jgi:endoglucanase